MTRAALIGAGCLLALAGCGGDGGSTRSERPAGGAAEERTTPEGEGASKGSGPGTTVRVGESEFGPMLFDARRQAIYIFENDSRGRSVCSGECAEAWPPVLTDARPRAGRGVRESLLGTLERSDGGRQVTYAGRPLYFYANEEPGQVLCHNVDLNGGLWWVVGPDGRRRP